MEIFEKFTDKTKSLNFYELALNEFESNNFIKGVYAKAIALSKGDESKVRSFYLDLRVKVLEKESEEYRRNIISENTQKK